MSEGNDYWRGATDARLADAERRLATINGSIEKTATRLGSIETSLASIKTKVSIWSALGAALGAAIFSTIFRHI